MSAVIAWTCKLCGHHVEGLSVDEFMQLDNAHACKVADQIRRAVPYWRRRSEASHAVADWLEDCARNADAMAHPDDFDICDEPGSVRHALRVAKTTPWEEPS